MEKVSRASRDRFLSSQKTPSTSFSGSAPAVVGILKTTILPSLSVHSSLALIAYAAARATNRVELKDWLWPTGQLINAWWTAVGRHVFYHDSSFGAAWEVLTWNEKLLLGGVTAWGLRLFYRIATRSIKRGKDDPRYEEPKKEKDFWNKALFTLFLPEAVFQTIITLPFTMAFRLGSAGALGVNSEYSDLIRSLSVGLFSAGFAMEVLADAQLEAHRQKSGDLNREGVWSIIRHPNYLGDALCHFSFTMLLYGTNLLHPLAVLGPVANYAFLRLVGGDKENEASQEERYRKHDQHKLEQLQEWRKEKNSFWPRVKELSNLWTWALVGVGVAGAALEIGFRSSLSESSHEVIPAMSTTPSTMAHSVL